jgi:hypothetical protein
MRNCLKTDLVTLTFGIAFCWMLLVARPVRADQIVFLLDEHGHKVYINTGDSVTQDHSSHSFSSTTLPPAEISRLVEQTAERHDVDPELVHAIIQVESDYDPAAMSHKGAMGLMQLIPATAQRFGVQNPFDPKQNIEGGVTYLRHLLDLFQGDLELSLAAYNAGENSVLRRGGIPAYTETRNYVRKVTDIYAPGSNGQVGKVAGRPLKAPIYRFVDAQGIVHFTNGDEF